MVNAQEPSELQEGKRKNRSGIATYWITNRSWKTTQLRWHWTVKNETKQKCRQSKLFRQHVASRGKITPVKARPPACLTCADRGDRHERKCKSCLPAWTGTTLLESTCKAPPTSGRKKSGESKPAGCPPGNSRTMYSSSRNWPLHIGPFQHLVLPTSQQT